MIITPTMIPTTDIFIYYYNITIPTYDCVTLQKFRHLKFKMDIQNFRVEEQENKFSKLVPPLTRFNSGK